MNTNKNYILVVEKINEVASKEIRQHLVCMRNALANMQANTWSYADSVAKICASEDFGATFGDKSAFADSVNMSVGAITKMCKASEYRALVTERAKSGNVYDIIIKTSLPVESMYLLSAFDKKKGNLEAIVDLLPCTVAELKNAIRDYWSVAETETETETKTETETETETKTETETETETEIETETTKPVTREEIRRWLDKCPVGLSADAYTEILAIICKGR